jgi:hypothetical protein
MVFRWAANAVLIVHLAFILFVLFGAGLVAKWRWIILVQIPAAAWGAFVEFTGRICPLTGWENELLGKAGQAGYPEGCIDHYLARIIYPDGLTQGIQVVLACLVIGVNVGVYSWLFLRRRR